MPSNLEFSKKKIQKFGRVVFLAFALIGFQGSNSFARGPALPQYSSDIKTFNNNDPIHDLSYDLEGPTHHLLQELQKLRDLSRHPLTAEEKKSIKYYSEIGYFFINSDLRKSLEGGSISPKRQKNIEALKDALAKLQPYRKQSGVVYRGVTLPDEVRDLHQVGSVVTYAGFTSTSQKKSRTLPGRDRFIIYSRSGRDISESSAFPNEKEVLIPPGAVFRVEERKEETFVNTYVLQEIVPEGVETEGQKQLFESSSMIWMP